MHTHKYCSKRARRPLAYFDKGFFHPNIFPNGQARTASVRRLRRRRQRAAEA